MKKTLLWLSWMKCSYQLEKRRYDEIRNHRWHQSNVLVNATASSQSHRPREQSPLFFSRGTDRPGRSRHPEAVATQVDQIPIFQRSTADQQCTPQTSGVPSGNPKQELKNLPNAKLSRILKIGAVLHESHLGSRQNLGRIPRNARAVGLLIEISARQMRPN